MELITDFESGVEMAAYMLFVEGRTDGAGLVAELDLEEIERDHSALIWSASDSGPGGKPGMLGYWIDNERAGSPRFEAHRQKWIAASGNLWVGTHLEAPLRPQDIQRAEPASTANCWIALEDGNEWLIPCASGLPHLWGEDAEGNFTRTPKDTYKEFCAEAGRVYQLFVEHDETSSAWNIAADWDYVCRALSLNYRLARPIISALGLIGDRSGAALLAATVGLRQIRTTEADKAAD